MQESCDARHLFLTIFYLIFPSSAKNKIYDMSPRPENERNCNILSSERQFFLLHTNFETHFDKIYKKAGGRVNLLRRIRSSIDTLYSAQRIYQSMIMSIFTYCGYKSLGWSESRKSMIRSMLRNEASKSFPRNAVRRTAIFDF